MPAAARKLFDGLWNADVEEVSAGLCDDALLTLSSRNYATGKPRVRRLLVRAFGAVYSIRCKPVVVWAQRSLAIIDADVDCERWDRVHVTFPATVVLRFRDELISEIRLSTYEPALMGNLGGFTGPLV